MKKSMIIFAALWVIDYHAQYFTKWATYPTGYKMNAAFRTNVTSGIFTIGSINTSYNVPNLPAFNGNFWAEFTQPANALNISNSYQIFLSDNCSGSWPFNQLNNCSGVSAIETVAPPNIQFAIAGASAEGVFFIGLDGYAQPGPVNMFYPFPYKSRIVPAKPVIVEDIYQRNNYYICGSFDKNLYIIKIDKNGVIIWSTFYKLSTGNFAIVPKGIILNPVAANTSAELVVIGNVEFQHGGKDAFFMTVDRSNGTANSCNTYGMPGPRNIEEFRCITPSSSNNVNGYLIGGKCDQNSKTSPGMSWVLKTDIYGNISWSKIVNTSSDTDNGEIVSVKERLNTLGAYECYGVITSSVGMIVAKLDQAGNPFNSAGASALAPNEFVYNLPGNAIAEPASLTYKNGPVTDPEVGLQVYGTAYNSPGWNSSYMVTAYFDGQTSCNSTLTVLNESTSGAGERQTYNPAKYGGFTQCDKMYVIATPAAVFNISCENTLSSGSNQRGVVTGLNGNMKEEIISEPVFSVFPNPVKDKVTISFQAGGHTATITIYDLMGNLVKTFDEGTLGGNDETKEIDLSGLNIASGIYVLSVQTNGEAFTKKIVYTK